VGLLVMTGKGVLVGVGVTVAVRDPQPMSNSPPTAATATKVTSRCPLAIFKMLSDPCGSAVKRPVSGERADTRRQWNQPAVPGRGAGCHYTQESGREQEGRQIAPRNPIPGRGRGVLAMAPSG
jgi:hypothetical protein